MKKSAAGDRAVARRAGAAVGMGWESAYGERMPGVVGVGAGEGEWREVGGRFVGMVEEDGVVGAMGEWGEENEEEEKGEGKGQGEEEDSGEE